MNNKKTAGIILSISILFFLFSLVKKNDSSGNSLKSVLLNPGVKDQIQALILQSPDEILTIRNDGKSWICEKKGIYTKASDKNVNNLINYLTTIRNMYKISDTKDGKIPLNLTEESAFIITVIADNGKPAARLFFGNTDSLTSRINVSSEKSRNSYEVQDDFSPYLKTDLNFWTVPEIFFSIKNPSNLKLNKNDLYTLQSLRHGQVLDTDSLPNNCVKVRRIFIKGQLEDSQTVDFYEKYTPDGKEYFYIQHLEPEVFNNNAVYSLSQWTYQRITKLLPE